MLIDNLRLDQWRTLEPILRQYFRVEEQGLFYSILPTATQYARNAIFAGMLPSEMKSVSRASGSPRTRRAARTPTRRSSCWGSCSGWAEGEGQLPQDRNLNAGRKLSERLDDLSGNALERDRLQLRGHAEPRPYGHGSDRESWPRTMPPTAA